MAGNTAQQPTTRVLLWAPPRSLSTVLEKCLSYVDGIQIIHEPFLCASQAGPEKIKQESEALASVQDLLERSGKDAQFPGGVIGWDDKKCTFQWVKDTLEAEYSDKKILFCKDIINGIVGKFHMIPRGYRHTVIIRNPTKAILSLRKVIIKTLPPSIPADKFRMDMMKTAVDTSKVFFGNLIELIDYLKEQGIEEEPVIIDADDLQNNPASILRQYCQVVGIPYSDSLLKWEAGDDIVKKNWITSRSLLEGHKLVGFYATAFASTGFQPATNPPATNELPPDVIALTEKAAPFYNALYERRLRP